MNEEFYISIIGEVFDGYTEAEFNGETIYIKHFSIKDQRYIHKFFEKHKRQAILRGVETEEQILKRLKEDDIWNAADDSKISSLTLEIKNLRNTQKSLFIPSQKEKVGETIKERESELVALQRKREEVVGRTAEAYASSRASQEMLRHFIYKDQDLKIPKFTEEEFDEIEDVDLLGLHMEQTALSNRLCEKNLQAAVLRPFFSMYLSLCEDVSGFYRKPITELSAYQLKAALFGRMFHNIFQNVEDIPDSIRDDPEKLLAFADSQRNKDSRKKFIKDDAAATAVFGATKEDIKTLSSDTGSGAVSLSEELKKAGGSLNMEQMMKLAGH